MKLFWSDLRADVNALLWLLYHVSLQNFDAVGWAVGRHPACRNFALKPLCYGSWHWWGTLQAVAPYGNPNLPVTATKGATGLPRFIWKWPLAQSVSVCVWLSCHTVFNSKTRNVLDCDQSNYSSRIIFSCTFTLGLNTNRTGWTISEIRPFKIMQDGWRPWSWIWSNRK